MANTTVMATVMAEAIASVRAMKPMAQLKIEVMALKSIPLGKGAEGR